MEQYSADTRVTVRPFAQHREGGTVTIGDLDRQVFLDIPEEGVDILGWLAEGNTVGQTLSRYELKYGEIPDLEDFLDAMAQEGFLEAGTEVDELAPGSRRSSGWRLDRISPSLSARIFSPAAIVGYALLIACALLLIGTDPGLVPGPSVLVFPHYLAALSFGIFAFGLSGVAIHEIGHLVAARAAGVPARIGLNHRLWVVVAETDMSGIWMSSKRRRYIAFLAGPLVDAVSASVLVGFLWAHRQGWFALSPVMTQIAGACLMTYLLRLLWECFFFVRTDFYYVVATVLNCKNLLGDTETFIRNVVARLVRSRPTVDQTAIPAEEMRVVRLYSLIWLIGRAAALATLVFITLPVMWRYAVAIAPMLSGGPSRYGLVDVLMLAAVTIGMQGAGLVLWLRGLVLAMTKRRSDALARS